MELCFLFLSSIFTHDNTSLHCQNRTKNRIHNEIVMQKEINLLKTETKTKREKIEMNHAKKNRQITSNRYERRQNKQQTKRIATCVCMEIDYLVF